MREQTKPREPQLITPGTIAREIGQPLHRVQHVLATRPAIRPAARAGTIRLYDREAVERVRREIDRMDAARAARRRGDA